MLGRHAKGGGSQKCPNCEACKESVEHLLFECAVYHMITRDKMFWTTLYIKQFFTLEAFEAFNHRSIFDKAVFCLGEKQGTCVHVQCILVHNECSSWYMYNRVIDFSMSVWDRRKEIL